MSATATKDTADQTLFGIRLVLSDHGIQRALMQADTAFTYEDNTRTELRVVRSTFFTEAGVKNGNLTSREGTYNTRSGNMEARGNVVVISEDGQTRSRERYRLVGRDQFVYTLELSRDAGRSYDPVALEMTFTRVE